MKILIIKFRNIGDVLLASPLVTNLQHHFPNARIDFALNSNCQEIFRANPKINELISYDREKIKSLNLFLRLKAELSILKLIRKKKYNLVINLTEGDRGSIYALFSKAELKIGHPVRNSFLKKINIFDFLLDETKDHAVKRDLHVLRYLKRGVIDEKIEFIIEKGVKSSIEINYIELLNTSFVIVHPVSRWMFKCWDDEKMARIIDYLSIKKNLKVVLTSSQEEIELNRIARIKALTETDLIDLSGRLSLSELRFLISRAKLFFGIDSAPMHIAASTDTTIFALFGASYPSIWGPWNNSNSTFENIDGFQSNGKHFIISNMQSSIFYENGEKKSTGMRNISYESVKEVLNSIL